MGFSRLAIMSELMSTNLGLNSRANKNVMIFSLLMLMLIYLSTKL